MAICQHFFSFGEKQQSDGAVSAAKCRSAAVWRGGVASNRGNLPRIWRANYIKTLKNQYFARLARYLQQGKV
ncbi:MAG: hypothetical protein MJ058_00510 [Akkermansia sp.]|nr:hypothetical protein [Akkermansia sp.]